MNIDQNEPPFFDARLEYEYQLAEWIEDLSYKNDRLLDIISIGQWESTYIKKIDAKQRFSELRKELRDLRDDMKSLMNERDFLKKELAGYKRQLKGLGNV